FLNNIVESRGWLFARQLVAPFYCLSLLFSHDLLGYGLGYRADTARVSLATIEEVVIPAFPALIEAHNIFLTPKNRPEATLCPWPVDVLPLLLLGEQTPYNNPSSANEKNCPSPPMIMWSSTAMPKSLPASTSRVVKARSSRLGWQSPLG